MNIPIFHTPQNYDFKMLHGQTFIKRYMNMCTAFPRHVYIFEHLIIFVKNFCQNRIFLISFQYSHLIQMSITFTYLQKDCWQNKILSFCSFENIEDCSCVLFIYPSRNSHASAPSSFFFSQIHLSFQEKDSKRRKEHRD